MMSKFRYRYADEMWESGIRIRLILYAVIKETEKGAWIKASDRRFVLNGIGKRFAHETREAALNSYLARKSRQASIYAHRLDSAREAIRLGQYLEKNIDKLAPWGSFGDIHIPLSYPL